MKCKHCHSCCDTPFEKHFLDIGCYSEGGWANLRCPNCPCLEDEIFGEHDISDFIEALDGEMEAVDHD